MIHEEFGHGHSDCRYGAGDPEPPHTDGSEPAPVCYCGCAVAIHSMAVTAPPALSGIHGRTGV